MAIIKKMCKFAAFLLRIPTKPAEIEPIPQ